MDSVWFSLHTGSIIVKRLFGSTKFNYLLLLQLFIYFHMPSNSCTVQPNMWFTTHNCNYYSIKKHHNNECWLKKRTWMIGRDDVNTFVSSSGSQFKWLHQFWNLHSNSLWLTYSKFRPNIISKTKKNDIQLFSTSPFTRQSELVKLELYFTLYTWIYT